MISADFISIRKGRDNMMNKSHIGWCDFSWNPITGCKKDCDFCYGKKQARRLCGTVRLNKSNPQIHWNKEQKIAVLPAPFHTESDSVIQFPAGFSPTFHPYRLKMIADKQKPANIYVCSMGEMFGAWIPLEWITAVFDACKAAPWHNYMFLTKNPIRYEELAQSGILPTGDNFWYGTRISENTQAFVSEKYHTFICIEPIGKFAESYEIPKVEWAIIGCDALLPSKRNMPESSWLTSLMEQCGDIPVFIKDNEAVRTIWKGKLLKQKPILLQRPKDKPIPHCEQCNYCLMIREGKRGNRHICRHGKIIRKEQNGRHITGRYARTSPPWCPKR